MITLFIEVQVRPEKWNEFLAIIKSAKKRLEENDNCNQIEIYVDYDNQFTYSIDSVWKNSQVFAKFLESDEFSMILLAFKLLKRNPKVRYFKKEEVGGIESLMQLRKLAK